MAATDSGQEADLPLRAVGYLTSMRSWPSRRWAVAVGATLLYATVVAVPTDLIDTPLFWRAIAPTWWSWPALILSSVLAGLLAATFVEPASRRGGRVGTPSTRRGLIGGLLTFFAVGCPVCNKLVLVALGTTGALTWFEPVQPVLQVVAISLLAWALLLRLRGESVCPTPTSAETRTQTRRRR